jgi:hypothetical protein
MRPGNARIPLVIAGVAAGLTYLHLGLSSPFGGIASLHHLIHAHPAPGKSAEPVVTRNAVAAPFDGVVLDSRAATTIVIGESPSVVVDSTGGPEAGIRTYVADGKLIVSGHDPAGHVTVTLPHLRSLRTDGPADVTLSGLKDPLTIVANGPATLRATGAVASLQLTLNGPSNLDLAGLEAKTLAIRMNGGGDAKVFATDSLVAEVHGMGRVRYLGDPKTVTTVDGRGSIGPVAASTAG